MIASHEMTKNPKLVRVILNDGNKRYALNINFTTYDYTEIKTFDTYSKGSDRGRLPQYKNRVFVRNISKKGCPYIMEVDTMEQAKFMKMYIEYVMNKLAQ